MGATTGTPEPEETDGEEQAGWATGAHWQVGEIDGLKLARLVQRDGELSLAPLFDRPGGSGEYSVEDEAVCEQGHGHTAPAWSCTCGFHAVRDAADLWRLGAGRLDLAILDVEMSGEIVEHDHGLRAARQRVTRCRVANRCSRCGRDATVLARLTRRGRVVVPACARCARGRASWTAGAAAEMLSCPVVMCTTGSSRAPSRQRLMLVLAQVVPQIVAGLVGLVATLSAGMPALGAAMGITAGALTCFAPHTAELVGRGLGVEEQERHRLRNRMLGATLAVGLASYGTCAMVAASMQV